MLIGGKIVAPTNRGCPIDARNPENRRRDDPAFPPERTRTLNNGTKIIQVSPE